MKKKRRGPEVGAFTQPSRIQIGNSLVDPAAGEAMSSIPMSSPDLTEAEIQAVKQVLNTRTLSIGPRLDAFENGVAKYLQVRYAVGVSSGTAGLHLAVIAAGVRDQGIVVTTAFSFIASANCVLYERGIPVFVDVDPKTGNIDPGLVEEAVHELRKGGRSADAWLPPSHRGYAKGFSALRAILPIGAFGQPADMERITNVARKNRLAVIEDACECIGAEYKGRKAGTLGDVGVFAFYPNKQMTTGEGGIIVTDRDDWNMLFRSLRNQGRDVFNAWLNHTRLGYNYRLDEIRAALGVGQLNRLEDLLHNRALVAGFYNSRLQSEEHIEAPFIAQTTTKMSWFVYVVRIKPPIVRDSIMQSLAEQGIPSRPYFTPIHLQPYYAKMFGYRRGDFPITEELGDISLALPFSGVMTEDQVDQVCEAVKRAIRKYLDKG